MVTIAPPRPRTLDRTALIALGLVAAAFVATLAGPLWLLLLTPLVFGTPHIAADLRYLVLHGPTCLRPSTIVALTVPLAAMVAFRAAGLAGAVVDLRLEVALGCAAVMATAVAARTSLVVVAAVLAFAIPAIAEPRITTLILLHVHNAVAFVIWLRWTRGGPARWPLLALTLAGLALIAVGAFDALLPHDGPLDGDALARSFAPGLGPVAGGRVVLLYAFMQALHYIVWLFLIPQSRSLGTSLRQDFGPAALAAFAVGTLAVPLCAFVITPARVRDAYLAVVVFHAWLELAIIGHLVAGRDRLEDACRSPG